MIFLRALLIVGSCVLFYGLAGAQIQNAPDGIKSSPAYAEILLRKTEILAEIEAVSPDYTETHPKMLDLRFELASLDRSLERVFAIKPTETGRLTEALGKLIVKHAALDAELNHLMRSYNKEHPDVKRSKRRLDIFESAINDILR